MAPPSLKKRSHQEFSKKPKPQRPSKKQRKQALAAYDSDSDEETNVDFKPVDLLDSDNEDLENVPVDDGASSSGSGSDSGSASEDESSGRQKLQKRKPAPASEAKKSPKPDTEDDSEEDEGQGNDKYDLVGADSDDGDSDSGSEEENEDGVSAGRKPKSKRNDPTAFANSLFKILGTKLSSTRKSDPVLSRSVDAHKASKQIVDEALEAKARKAMRQKKLEALEKGRVKDVLVATENKATGEIEASTAGILETEKRLRKVAQRGVVKLFNAVRQAQVRGQEADRVARKEGVHGVQRREQKVNEMSRKGFLDLVASGGGGLKKGGLEEA